MIWGRKWMSTLWGCCPKQHVYTSSASHRLRDNNVWTLQTLLSRSVSAKSRKLKPKTLTETISYCSGNPAMLLSSWSKAVSPGGDPRLWGFSFPVYNSLTTNLELNTQTSYRRMCYFDSIKFFLKICSLDLVNNQKQQWSCYWISVPLVIAERKT